LKPFADIQWDPAALLNLINSLDAFIPPHHTPTPAFVANNATLRKILINHDVETLQHISVQIESLTNDEEQVRAWLVNPAGNSSVPTGGDPNTPLVRLLGFVERGAPPSYWNNEPESERLQWEKTFGYCKGAIIKGIVAVADEDPHTGVLWGPNEADGGWFVKRMINWIKDYPVSVRAVTDDERDDLVICATLCLANLARRGT
jgi:Rap1 GTPase-GDP dissociation stimulator 1